MTSRAKKSGIGLQLENKMEANYDREEEAGTPAHIVTWLNNQMNDETPIAGSSCQIIHRHLQDGTYLCRLINKLLAKEGKPQLKFSKKAGTPFVARENIQKYNDGCEAFGLGKESLFQSDDLYEGRKSTMYNVINNLHVLAHKSNERGYMPAYLGQIIKTLDE